MPRYQPNLFTYLREYYTGTSTLGMEPVLILDTSAIIDLEAAFRKQYGALKGHLHLERLITTTTSRGLRFVVPPLILEEIECHHLYHQRRGIPEVSETTLCQ